MKKIKSELYELLLPVCYSLKSSYLTLITSQRHSLRLSLGSHLKNLWYLPWLKTHLPGNQIGQFSLWHYFKVRCLVVANPESNTIIFYLNYRLWGLKGLNSDVSAV